MKVLLIGCGAVGLSIASALYGSNVETELIARGNTAEAIRKNGIERIGIFGHAVISPDKVKVFETIEDAGEGYDFILVSAKTTANADIAKSLAVRKNDILSPNGLIVLSQNGIGNEQEFIKTFETNRIYHASFAIGFKRPKLNTSEVTVFSVPVSIGSIFGDSEEKCKELAKAIENGGIPCRVTNEIGKRIWAKLLYNCTLNALSAILRTNYGGLTKSEEVISIMKGIIEEVFEVMHASGYQTIWENAEVYKREFFDRILPPTYEHNSSTLQDVERKVRTEIDSLNGAVMELGRKFNIDTPCNTIITQIIKGIESLY